MKEALFTDWKIELRKLKLDNIKDAAPGFFELSGGYNMKIKPYNDRTSNGLTRCIIDFINFNGGYANRINTQGQIRRERITLAHGNYRDLTRFTPSTTNKGTGDVHAIIKGRSVSIEIKIGRDKMSQAQLKEQARVIDAGGLYFIARDMESFVKWFNKIFNRHTN